MIVVVLWWKMTPHIPMAMRLKKMKLPITMAVQPKTTPCIAVAAQQTTMLRNAMAAQ
jgi:hypothetical protein